MGVRTDAILLYGIKLGSQEEWDGDEKHPLAIAAEALGEPPMEFGLEWIDYESALDAQARSRGLEVVMTGHIEGCPSWFLVATSRVAHRGYEENLGRSLPGLPKDNKIAILTELAKKLDITGPRWWLASYSDF